MARFGSGVLDHAGFVAIKDQLTAELASKIEAKLEEMGDDVKGISWFSSCADQYVAWTRKRAA